MVGVGGGIIVSKNKVKGIENLKERKTKRKLRYVETGLKITRQNKKFKDIFSKRP